MLIQIANSNGDADAVAAAETEREMRISERDEVENMITKIKDSSAFYFEAFMPVNEVNFEAWKSANESLLFEEVTSKLNKDLQDEISRAISVEAELDIKVTDIISNTDVSQIDSFVEIIDKVNEVTATNFDSIYAKKVGVTFDGVDTVTLAVPVKPESMMLFFNGLMVEANFDYTETIADGMVVGATLTAESAAFLLESNVRLSAHGVYGEFSNISFIGIDFAKLIAEAHAAEADLHEQRQSLAMAEEEAHTEFSTYKADTNSSIEQLDDEIANLNEMIADAEAAKEAAIAAGDTEKADEATSAIQKYQSDMTTSKMEKDTLEMDLADATDQRIKSKSEASEAIDAIEAQISTLTKEIAELQAQKAAAEA